MLRSLLKKLDDKFFAWLEGESTAGSKRERTSRKDRDGRSEVSQRGVDSKRPKIQIPDPWD